MLIQIMKYGLAAALSYIFVISSTYFLVEILKMNPSIAYFIVITVAYIYNYFVSSMFVFRSKMDKRTLYKFMVYLIVFWLVNNLLFNYLVAFWHIPYIYAVVFNLVFLGLIRFFVQRQYVFNISEPSDQS